MGKTHKDLMAVLSIDEQNSIRMEAKKRMIEYRDLKEFRKAVGFTQNKVVRKVGNPS